MESLLYNKSNTIVENFIVLKEKEILYRSIQLGNIVNNIYLVNHHDTKIQKYKNTKIQKI